MPSNLDPALLRMTGTPQGDLSFEGILQTLSGIPAERLIQYRHKLSCLHQDTKSCHLLHVLILWSLGRENEARVYLNSFRDDVVAHHLSQGLWGTGGAKTTTPEQLKDQAKVARAVAEIYSLLVEEKLCEPLARDEAYRTAIQAFRASHMEGAQLKGLLDEAMEKCGLPFLSTVPRSNSGALASDLASRSSEPSSVVPPDDERQFYTFVVLHAAEDELVACRVREHLEALGVSNGATFSEDFLVPGCGQLNCFQNALDNSAFTLVLLTKNFTGRLCDYQRDTALMDSLTRCCKRNSVIPLVPKEHTLKSGEMPLLLASLVPLVEKSPVFGKRVKKTFTSRVIQEKKATWNFMRQIQEREEERERERENLRLQHLAVLNLQPSPALPPVVDISRPQTSFMEPGPDQASFSQPFMFSVGSPNAMPGPQLIIQNAQMIQIGDYNRMQVERSNAAVGTINETIEGPPVEEGEDNPGEQK